MYDLEKYKEISEYCKKDLALLEDRLKSLLFENKTELEDSLYDFLFAKSKRLRPVLIFLIKDALGAETNEDILNLALATELLHSATLLHDDIIDDAIKRRNLPALNKVYDPRIATLAGDYLLSLSEGVLAKINSPEIVSIFSKYTLEICRGEINQFFNKNKVTTIEEYLEKSKNKTSALFMAGAEGLLHILNPEKAAKEAILNFTLNFSLGFQIYDDIENFKNENTEKTSSDLQNGVLTLPCLYLSQENSYGIIEYENLSQKMHKEALDFSNGFLNNVLEKAKESLNSTEIKKDMLLKTADVFRS